MAAHFESAGLAEFLDHILPRRFFPGIKAEIRRVEECLRAG